MPTKVAVYAQLAEHTAAQITGSRADWTGFLTSVGRLYKYPYNEQLMIYAQRPDAVACADYDLWNDKMKRFVKRGSKGIALIDATGDTPKLHYVFDVADTGGGENSRRPYLWEMKEEHSAPVLEMLAERYGGNGGDLADSLYNIAEDLASEYYDYHSRDIPYVIPNSFLEDFDEDNIRVAFENAATISIAYTLMKRCGLDPDTYFGHEDFLSIFDFNTPDCAALLGTAVSEQSEQVLRQIEVTIKNFERGRSKENERISQPNAARRQNEDRGLRANLQPERGLSDSRPHHDGADTAGRRPPSDRQIREDAENVSDGTSGSVIQFPAAVRETVSALLRNRPDSEQPIGTADERAIADPPRAGQGDPSNGVGGTHEQPQTFGGRNDIDGAYLQLSLFPTEQAQIRQIAESEQLSAFSMPQSDIDHILRTGGNDEHSLHHICANYQKNRSAAENAAFLQREYGEGGKGLFLNKQKVSVWFNAEGIHLAKGDAALYASSKLLITWEQAEQRIGELLTQGQFVPQGVFGAAELRERQELAQTLWYVHQDFADGARGVFFDEEIFKGGFPSSTAHIAELFAQPQELEKLIGQLETFTAAYEQNSDLMRFHFQNPKKLIAALSDLKRPKREFTAGITDVAFSPMFVTQDELDSVIAGGSQKLAVYEFFTQLHSTKEKEKFIREKHGIGGGGDNQVYRSYDGKGFTYTRGDLLDPDAAAFLPWSQVARRIDYLISNNRYLTAEEKGKIAEHQRETAGISATAHDMPMVSEPTVTPAVETAPVPVTPPVAVEPTAAVSQKITQSDIDAALQGWNGEITSKHTVIRQMEKHAREKNTAAFLRAEFGGDLPVFTVAKGENSLELPWAKVQRRIAQLITEDKFYTEAERDNMDDVDPVAIRERLESGEESDFVQQVFADVERLAEPETAAPVEAFPYAVGDTVYLENGVPFIIEEVGDYNIRLRDPSLFYPVARAESKDSFLRLMGQYPQPTAAAPKLSKPDNFHITDVHLGEGGAKTKFQNNVAAICTLQAIEKDERFATAEEQEILSKYVGWGGLAQAFDSANGSWGGEYTQLKALLSEDEYTSARASTLNAHYTSPTVIKAIYDTVERMGFTTGNILEPACGAGNFFGMLPESMAQSKLYGVELDSLTGRIAGQLYPHADITVSGFERTRLPDSFFDLAVGNVPFGGYKVSDKQYDKQNFLIHDYFFAKTLDQVRPGGVVAFITSKGTMDKQSPEVRRYIAQRAELLGAVRLPNNAFLKNAGTEVTSDILFLQKRDRPIEISADWIALSKTEDGVPLNSYFVEHPEMVLGTMAWDDRMYGDKSETACVPTPGADLAEQLKTALSNIEGKITEAELPDMEMSADTSIPADPNVKNFSYTLVNGEVYYRENSRMVRPELSDTAKERITGLVELRNSAHALMDFQLEDYSDDTIRKEQVKLNGLYDRFTAKYGLINSRENSRTFSEDSAYYLLCSLENINENGELESKADMFTKRTIKQHRVVTAVDTASEALSISISEKAGIDLAYMEQLTGLPFEQLISDLQGVIFKNPNGYADEKLGWETADEYLSGNVRQKLSTAIAANEVTQGRYAANVKALEAAQPKDLDASEIEVRLGATWIDKRYIQQFMYELLETPRNARDDVKVNFSTYTAEWNISGKNTISYNNVAAFVTYGTDRANAYKILEDTLNLRDIRIYDTVVDPDGKERRVLNRNATTLAQQKQQTIKESFRDWIWRDADRRQTLVKQYNERFNATRPREYDGQHIIFSGINPEIKLYTHQLNAIAHVLYGGNTLLAHEVGAGKTFEMVGAAMESKRLGLCQKSLFAVPNHLTEQWASEFLRLYPSANILVATKKDFEAHNRKKFCARIATGDYDAIIIGHSQFERIPISTERQERLLQEQIWEITDGIAEVKASGGERFTVKQLERTKKSLEARLEKLLETGRKDDVVTFEQLGVDRLYVDEAHSFKNLFLYTKMRNVAGLSTTDAQKSSDMFLKCRYIDEKTNGKGIVFATGTPVSNSMTELYTMMRYLQYFTLQRQGLSHFDCWASTFGETVTAIELAPEGTGYRARTRFAKFFNLPELMTLFKEVADIKTSDQLDLRIPKANYHTVVVPPTEHQKDMVQELSKRAAIVHANKVDPSVDNMLKITSDGRKLGLDQRIVNPLLPDDPQSKVNACVNNILSIWRDGQPKKLTQLVFCDISTPKGKPAAPTKQEVAAKSEDALLLADMELPTESATAFSVYDDIRAKLIGQGIPAEQVAFIHEANTEIRKKELFAKVRSGQVRVLMGSTAKLGAGTNVQDRLVALHDLDCPWRPGDLTQRSGRIIRQGNKNKEVDIFRYVTEGTFDSYLYQTVENKQKFISQIMTSKSPVRSCEDVDETALSYAEIKALCAGNPKIKEKMDLDIDVARLKLLKADHQSQQYKLEDNLLKYYPENIERSKGFIRGFEQDMAQLKDNTPTQDDVFSPVEILGVIYPDKEKAGAAILEACKVIKDSDPVEVGHYKGFALSISFESFEKEYKITLKGAMSHTAALGTDAKGNLIRMDNALAAMPERLQAVQVQLENLYQQTDAAKVQLGKPFLQEQELKEKVDRLTVLDVELNIDAGAPAADTPALKQSIAKTERPSLLEGLKLPPKVGAVSDRKPKTEREVR